jgi:hypothetical protein
MMKDRENQCNREIELTKAEAFAQLRPHIEMAKRPCWFPWRRHARRRDIRQAAVTYLDSVLSAHVRRLDSKFLPQDLDVEAFGRSAIEDATNFVNEPLVTDVADEHRDMLIKAFRMLYLRNLKAQEDLFAFPPAPPIPANEEPYEGMHAETSESKNEEMVEETEPPESVWDEPDLRWAYTPQPDQPTEATNGEPLPSLPREALQRIEQAERLAKERYDEDKRPYFPMHLEFSFLEHSIFRSISRILSYLQIFANEVLDANFKEYLEYAPVALLTNGALLKSVAENMVRQTEILWGGYGQFLMQEPTRRMARSTLKIVDGTIGEYPELEPCRYPSAEVWAEFVKRMSEPDSEMARMDAQYKSTIKQAIDDRLRHYQALATARLPVAKQPADPQPVRTGTEEERVGEGSEPMATASANTLTWQDIEIRFLSDERVQISSNGNLATHNYAEMGFEDGRRGTARLAWQTLQLLAQNGGDIPLESIQPRERTKVEKRVEEIRRNLRKHFSIEQDPVPFSRGIGYKTAFRVVWSRSADT